MVIAKAHVLSYLLNLGTRPAWASLGIVGLLGRDYARERSREGQC